MVWVETAWSWQRKGSAALAVAAGVLAVVVLWSWLAGVSDLLSFNPRQIPMAPSTALALAGLAVVLVAHLRPQSARSATGLAWGVVFLSAFVGALALFRPWLGWASPWEDWLAHGSVQLGAVPVGQMSPVTGALLGVISFALALQLPPAGNLAGARWWSRLLAWLVTGLGAGTAISYGFAQPWWYDLVSIPVAFPTALACMLLGLALLLAPTLNPVPGPEAPLRERLLGLPWPILTILMALLLGAVSAGYLRAEQAHRRLEALKLLKSIGDLKAGSVGHWRDHQWREAWLFSQATRLCDEVEAFLNHPGEQSSREKLLGRCANFTGPDRFSMIALFDAQGAPRLVWPEKPGAAPRLAPDLHTNLLRERRLLVADLHFAPMTNHPHLDLVFPVLPSGELAGKPTPPSGYFLLRADTAHGLEQILHSLETSSRSAETLLVRREGDTTLFLNDLRHQSNAALRLSFPLEPRSKIPAVLAVLGQTGTVEGVDYRGVPVLADTRAVSNSPWFLVTKMDRAELLDPLYHQAWLTLLVTLAVTGLIGVAFWLVRKQREVRRISADLALEHDRRILAERVEHLMKHANDLILLLDERGQMLEANDRVLEATGYTQTELRQMNLAGLRPASRRAELSLQLERLRKTGALRYETEVQRKEGTIFPVEVSMKRIELDGVGYLLGLARDISERKAQEREIARLTRLYATLSQINQCLVRVTSRDELFREVCRVTAEYAGFKLVWIGWLEPVTRAVWPVGRAGAEQGYLDKIKVTAEAAPEGQGPLGLCLRAGRPCIFNNFLDDPRALAWREAAVQHGLRAVAALPLKFGGQVCGALAVYADEPGVFQDKEIALLEEAALDISFALDNLETAAQRAQAEEQLRASEEHYRLLADNADDFVSLNHADGRRLYVSPSLPRVTGWSLEDFQSGYAGDWRKRIHPEDLPVVEKARAANLAGTATRIEYRMLCKNGDWLWMDTQCKPLPGPDGKTEKMLQWSRDITDRKRAEEALQRSEARFQQMTAAVEDVLYSVNGQTGEFDYVSPAFQRMLGYTLDDVARMGGREAFLAAIIQHDAFAEQRHRFVALQQQADGALPQSWQSWWRCQDGTLKFIEDRWIPIHAEGHLQSTFGVLRDETVRRRAEEALRASEERLRSMLEALPIPASVARKDGTIQYFNPAFTARYGYELNDAPTISVWLERAYPDAAYRQQVLTQWEADSAEAVRQGCATPPRVYQVTCKEGGRREVEIIMHPIGELWVASFHDLTERLQSEREIRARNEELERFNRASVGRELRMIELKQQINQLSRALDKPPPYPLDFDQPAGKDQP